ncbi:MAG: L-serine ammonia-lyase, iron-sulfur-dependent, subunit alpha [Defluviitaleaceae bacterium]|nr:L-serine ammonia-lyase, iron-sulfur-dependent, subunit alpha [Defluviitaleaceae bacterium]
MFRTVNELLNLSEEKGKPIAQIVIEKQAQTSGNTIEEIRNEMLKNLKTMEAAIEKGIQGVETLSKKSKNNGKLLNDYLARGNYLVGDTFVKAICYAVATNEVNASMGIICATPTAGSAGVLPAVLFSIKDKLQMNQNDCLDFLFAAGGFGLCIANSASISGAAGGCQAEIGSASAMAAAATVLAAKGTNQQAASALSLALKNMLGLVCDPVAGLVEIPCITRNAAGASNALTSAEMALAGIISIIPADETIQAMKEVGDRMHPDFKETGRGGMATTKTGLAIEQEIFGGKGPNAITTIVL